MKSPFSGSAGSRKKTKPWGSADKLAELCPCRGGDFVWKMEKKHTDPRDTAPITANGNINKMVTGVANGSPEGHRWFL